MVVIEALKGFLGYTTIHGCGRLGDSKYVIQRFFWCFATLGSIAMTSYQISRLYQQYRAKHLTTSLEVDSGNITFPNFRFCSLNPAPYSAVKNRTQLMAILYATQQHFGLNLSEFDSSGDITDLSDEVKKMSYEFNIGDLTDARILFGQELPFALQYDIQEDPLIHNINDVLLECVFQGQDCNNRGMSIVTTLDTLYGSCFDFRFGNASVYTAGPEEGLELMIYLNHAEFIPFIAEAIGINTRIYDSDSTILGESTDGVKLSAGFDIHISLSLTEYNRQQGKDNERCDSSQLYPSLLACYEDCLTELIASQCICDAGFRDCRPAETARCKRNLRKSIHSRCPHCKQPCK
ncbi:acid-sensing ion channel 1C-like [Argopecten irradians]|uniref:acid-sensing ion channel 1C-like n=1 Tax=Argopecten irradians TaxID=31199 RepID=UPI00371D7B1B